MLRHSLLSIALQTPNPSQLCDIPKNSYTLFLNFGHIMLCLPENCVWESRVELHFFLQLFTSNFYEGSVEDR